MRVGSWRKQGFPQNTLTYTSSNTYTNCYVFTLYTVMRCTVWYLTPTFSIYRRVFKYVISIKIFCMLYTLGVFSEGYLKSRSSLFSLVPCIFGLMPMRTWYEISLPTYIYTKKCLIQNFYSFATFKVLKKKTVAVVGHFYIGILIL